MNVILLERIRNLGDLGEEVAVKAGFARNFLIPQGKAVRATQENRQVFEGRRAELERVSNDRLVAAQARAANLTNVQVTIAAKSGEDGKLYGSVGTQDIADAVSRAQGVEVLKSEVRLPTGVIRVIGEYDIDLQLHSDVTVTVKVIVVPE
jgi:large subunit ribosomal protein L9